MAIRKIARLGHPVLRVPATAVSVEQIRSPETIQLINDMKDTVEDANGAGLAAPQVHESKQIVLLDLDDGNGMQVWINPTIEPLSEEIVVGFEGCLSVPNMRGAVARYYKIKVSGYTEMGEPFSVQLEDHPAVVAQHECDHLKGILYVDRVEPFTLCFLEEYKRFGNVLWQFVDDETSSEEK